MNSCNDHPEIGRLRSCLYVVLTLAVVWDLADPELRWSRLFSSSSAEGGDACDLDSFSEPGIAAAVLKQEAQRLLAAYVENRVEAASPLPSIQDPGRAGAGKSPMHGAAKPSPRQAPIIRSMERLRAELNDLESDLDRKLMGVYCDNDRWNDLLDCYLRCLYEAPENPLVVGWAPHALDCSRRCGRSDEVLQALQGAIRVQADLKQARRLSSILMQWRGEEPQGLAALNR